MLCQSLCFGVAGVCVNAFHTGLMSADQAMECAHKIQNMAEKHPEVSCIKKSNNYFSTCLELTIVHWKILD